jgi:hypothetical protein
MVDLHKNYLFDLGHLLREEALKARQAFQAEKGTPDAAFQSGRLMAYYEVLSLVISQAQSFNVPVADLHLSGLDPDRDLLDTPVQ